MGCFCRIASSRSRALPINRPVISIVSASRTRNVFIFVRSASSSHRRSIASASRWIMTSKASVIWSLVIAVLSCFFAKSSRSAHVQHRQRVRHVLARERARRRYGFSNKRKGLRRLLAHLVELGASSAVVKNLLRVKNPRPRAVIASVKLPASFAKSRAAYTECGVWLWVLLHASASFLTLPRRGLFLFLPPRRACVSGTRRRSAFV